MYDLKSFGWQFFFLLTFTLYNYVVVTCKASLVGGG